MKERVHDTYHSKRKLSEPSVCQGCGAVYRKGRWRWGAASPDAARVRCPACRRTEDQYPGGRIVLGGTFARAHRAEVVKAIRAVEEREKGEHPLNRIMEIGVSDGGLVVTTTHMRLARAIGDALERAYGGELAYDYAKDSDFLRVSWKR